MSDSASVESIGTEQIASTYMKILHVAGQERVENKRKVTCHLTILDHRLTYRRLFELMRL